MKTEKHFVVTWTIDEFCDNPLEAIKKAIMALPHERNEETIATIFDVKEIGENREVVKEYQIDTLEQNPFDDDYMAYAYDEYEEGREPLTTEEWEEEKQNEADSLQKTMDKCRDENWD